jgi:hypothetical protein
MRLGAADYRSALVADVSEESRLAILERTAGVARPEEGVAVRGKFDAAGVFTGSG